MSNPTVPTRRHMAKLAAMRKRPGPKPARTYEEIRADLRSRKRLRELRREFGGPIAPNE